jgi:L-iditol 2-dehydrogenase
MLAAYMYGKNDLRLKEVDKPQTGENEVLIKVKSAAICGTDVRMLQNGYKGITPDSPRILGHELSGVIDAVGKNVVMYREGMRVTVAPNMGCGICNACVRGEGHLCRDYKALGINIDGGFAEYVIVPEAAVRQGNIVELKDNVSFEEAAINEALSCVYNGFDRCDIRPGDTVLIIGAGPIGIMHAKLARLAGASKVMINDISNERLQVCRNIDKGFTTLESEGLKENVMNLTSNEGVNICITACPAPQAQILALELIAVNGRINFFGGLPADKQEVTLNTNLIHYRMPIVTGSTRASILQFRKTLEFISAGILDVNDLISQRIPLRNIHKGFEYAESAKGLKNVIVME